MKIHDMLNHIDGGHMALPVFQRGYVWNGEQVRKLFRSLYPRCELSYDCADPETGNQVAVLDLVWPEVLQSGLTAPLAVQIDEPDDVLSLASASGFRCFTGIEGLKDYVKTEVVGVQ